MPLDAQLQALEASLRAAVSGGQLILNETNMNGASSLPVVTLFQEAFQLSAITLGGTITFTEDDAHDLLIVAGSGVTTLYALTGTAVSLSFGSATPSTLSCYGTVTPPASPAWTFSTSFSSLDGTFFDQLDFTSPAFTISTYAVTHPTLGVVLAIGAGIYFQPTGLIGPLAPLLELNPTVPTPLSPFYGPLDQTATTLTISLSMPFSPVIIRIVDWPQLFFPQTDVVLTTGQNTTTGFSSSAILVEGAAGFGGMVTLPMAINVPWENRWRISLLPGDPQPLPSLTTFLAQFTGVDVTNVFPDSFQILPGFSLTAFFASFDLTTGVSTSWGFEVSTAPVGGTVTGTVWVILPGVIELRALVGSINVSIVRPGGLGTPETLISGTAGGVFRLGGTLDLMVALPVPLELDSEWTISMVNSLPLPSLNDLASLVAGVDVGLLLPDGVANIGAFTLQSTVLILNPARLSIQLFSFALGSTNPWTIIPGQLSIQNLYLEFRIAEPFATRAVSGTIYGSILIGSAEVLVTVERPQFGGDWSLSVTSEEIPLPSIEDLDQLIGTSIAPYLPSTLATLSFTIFDLSIKLNLTQAKIQQIAFGLVCDTEWTILPNVLVVKAVGITVNLSWYTGPMLTEFVVWGSLQVVGTNVDVSALRATDGNWTFTGGLAEGETISLARMVAQFLGFDPAYMPVSMDIEGLLVEFTTNDNSFLIAGQTAGFWTYEVSSALTLKMKAAASFQRNAAGESSGFLRGEFFVNSLQINVTYQFDTTSSTFIFQIIYKRFSLSAALTSGTDAKGKDYSLLKFSFGDLTFGEILEWLVSLAAPDSHFKLSPPWDVLNQINLKNLSVVVDLKTYDVTVTYAVDVNLVFMQLTSIGLTYSDAGGEGSVVLALSGSFLGQEYSADKGNALQWDVLNEDAPEVPASGPTLIDLKYVGLGQQVSFSDISELDTVGAVIAAMRAEMAEVNDGTKNPLAAGNGSLMRFDRASHLLLGADFEILETVSVSFIFNDPYLYGLRLALAGARAGSMAGLQFELLYKRITNDIGVFKVELRVPDAFRQFEFGAVSITLPVIKVDIYTNGNFRVDLGFPKGTDFSDSFCVQVFPFIGYGGFYFAYLTGATSEKVPVISNGTFAPVIELGIGLSVGLGKEIRKGPLSGGLYVTVIGILEGTVAWFSPDDKAARDGTFYRVEGIVGIVGKVYGKVDFAVIKVSVSLQAKLTVRVVLEAYQATTVQVTVEVEASATVTIFWIDVDFSFKVRLNESFVIGSASQPPWRLGPRAGSSAGSGFSQFQIAPRAERLPAAPPQLRGQRTSYLPQSRVREFRSQAWSENHLASRALGFSMESLTWAPLLVFDAKQALHMSLLPALTVATPPGGSAAVQIDFVLLVENSIPVGADSRNALRTPTAAHSSRADDPEALGFNLLVQLMFLWSTNSVLGRMTGNVTAADLDAIYTELLDPETFDTGFTSTNLLNLFAANFNGQMAGLPLDPNTATPVNSTVLAMLPQLSYLFNGVTVDFATTNPVSTAYEAQIRAYYEQLAVDFEWGRADSGTAEVPSGGGSDASMAALIFREYCMILARSVLQSARDVLETFAYTPGATDSLDTIAAAFPVVPGTYTVRAGDTVESIAAMFEMTVAELEALNGETLENPLTPGTSVNVQIAVTPATIAWANRQAALTSPQNLTLSGVLYQVAPGDSLTSIGARFGATTASAIAAIDVNAANAQLLAAGAVLTIAQPISPSFNWFNYGSVAGDNLQMIAVWAYVRAAAADPAPNGSWYAQTIVNFNTNPQLPFAGPDLAGVIATGTSLKIPDALNDSDPANAITYVSRAGDTLDRVAAYFDVIQNAAALLTPIQQGLQTLNPGVDFASLPVGTTIHVPAQSYTVAAGDSLAWVAATFLIAATDLANGTNASSTSLAAPLAVVVIPAFTYAVAATDAVAAATDTLASIAAAFNLTIPELAADVAAVEGLFESPADPPLTVPGVPSYSIADLASLLVSGGYANEAAMAVSRFAASGLRLPVEGNDATLQSLYVATAQQMQCPAPPAQITFSIDTGVTWFEFVSSFTAQGTALTDDDFARYPRLRELNPALDVDGVIPRGRIVLAETLTTLPFDITQQLLDDYAPSTTFDPEIVSGPSVLSIKQSNDVTYRLYRNVHWQAGSAIAYAGGVAAPPAGEPTLWAFSDTLLARVAALGSGTTPFALNTASGDPAVTPVTGAVGSYDWGAVVNVFVRQIAAPNVDAPLPNTYELAGSDEAGKAVLLALLDYLTGTGSSDTAKLYLVYPPNADSNNSNGIASGSVDVSRTFLIRTNLSTITTSGPTTFLAPKPDLYDATIASAADFIQLLWEGSVTASGGYLLGYADTGGKGLPKEVFAATPLGALQLVVILAAQSAATNPDRKLYAFNNCAIVGDNIDASRQTVFVSVADPAKVEQTEAASIPPGNVGFALTRTNPAATTDAAEQRTQQLYSLLAGHVLPGGGFSAGNEGLPASPVVPDSGDTAIWSYSQVLSLTQLTTPTLPTSAFLPGATADPYAGIAPGANATLTFAFHDLYGNDTTATTPPANLSAPVGYYDDVIGLAAWPGITTSYILGGTTAAPALVLSASLQASNYVPGSGTSFAAAQQSAAAHLVRYEAIYYQVWQSGLHLTLTTSLVDPPDAAATVFPLDLIPFAKFASASYIFIGTAQLVVPSTVTAGGNDTTLLAIAQGYTADAAFVSAAVASLGKANEDVATASLFGASLAIPQLYTSAFGDTLQAIVDKNAGGAITVVQLATQNQTVPLNPGIDVAAPQRTSAATTVATTFSDVASAMSASVARLADANAATQGLLAVNAAFTVSGVTIVVQLDPVSNLSQSLNDLVPRFAAQAVTTTPAVIATANSAVPAFTAGQSLLVDDYVIQAADTFASLQTAIPAFTLCALATAAKDSPNIFPAGIPLLIRFGTPEPVSTTSTLSSIAGIYGFTVEQLALANQSTALATSATVLLPERVTIASPATAVGPYTVPAAGMSIDGIAATFGESGSASFATRNWTLRYVFVPLQQVTVGTATATTQLDDSFGSLYDRLFAQDGSITEAQYVAVIAPKTTLIAMGALFATMLPSTGAAATTLTALATKFASTPSVIAQVNSSLFGFLVAGVEVSLGPLSLTTGNGETFTSLVSRFALLGIQTTVAEMALQNADQAIIAAQQRFLLAPSPVTRSVSLPLPPAGKSNFPSNPFRLVVDVTLSRDANRIDPQFAAVASVASSAARIAPFTTPPAGGGNSAAISMVTFATALETVFPAVKVAIGGDIATGGGTRDVWIVDFGPRGISSVTIDGTHPSFFALPPISNSLQDLTGVPIRQFDPATGTLVPESDPPLLDFQAVDLDVWAGIAFAAIDQVLSPGYAAPALRINSSALEQLLAAKKQLAGNISSGVLSILAGSSGDSGDAASQLEQALLSSLSNGFAVDAIVQYPVTVTSPFQDPPYTSATAPRLVGKLVDDIFRTGATDDLDSLATHYAVPAASMAMLLGGTIRILATGTEVTFKGTSHQLVDGQTIDTLMIAVGATSYQDLADNLETPDGFFQPFTSLGTGLVTGKSGDVGAVSALITFAALSAYYHVSLPLLGTSIQNATGLFIEGVTLVVPGHGSLVIDSTNNSLALAAAALGFALPWELAEAIQLQTGKLDPAFAIHFVRFVPQHDLSGAKVSLFDGDSTLNLLFSVKSDARAKNMFLNLDAHLNELEYDIHDVGDGYQASSWLSFVLPITGENPLGPSLSTNPGEVLIPIPLRAYPAVPSMSEQSGLASAGDPATVAAAKQWDYTFSYRTQEAAQDTLYLQLQFNQQPAGDLFLAGIVDTLGPALAQFVAAWPEVNTALSSLLSWDGSPDPVLAATVQTFAGLAGALSTGWTAAFLAAPAGTIATTYDYRIDFTTRSSADGLVDFRQSLLLSVLDGTAVSPTGQFPSISWRPAAGGDWLLLTLAAQTASDAVYLYVEDVPAAEPIEHRLETAGLDVVAWQNAVGSARLTRNEHLVASAATAPPFVCDTGRIAFAAPVVPFVQHDNLIVFNGGDPLDEALTRLFMDLLGTASPASDYLKVAVEFGYELVVTVAPVRPVASFLPVGFLPTSLYEATLPASIDALITSWQTGKPFRSTQGLYSLDVTIFTTLTPSSASKVPILRLNHLVYDNSGGGDDSFSNRLTRAALRRRLLISERRLLTQMSVK
jgi:LysM repeat protein